MGDGLYVLEADSKFLGAGPKASFEGSKATLVSGRFSTVFGGFGRRFGRFSGGQTEAEIDFLAFFSWCFSRS